MANVTKFERIQEHAMWTKSGPVVSHLPDEDIATLEEQAVATIGDPTPLGLWGFATGTWMVGTVIGGIFPTSAFTAVVPSLLIFAGIAQFIAGLFAYRRANSLAATAFCCFGAFNTVAAFTFLLQAMQMLPTSGDPRVLLGFFLESFGFIALALTIAALRTNTVLVAVLALLCIGYVLSGIPDLANNGGDGFGIVGNIGGWFLVASALCAYYAGMAMAVNSAGGALSCRLAASHNSHQPGTVAAILRSTVPDSIWRAIVVAARLISAPGGSPRRPIRDR